MKKKRYQKNKTLKNPNSQKNKILHRKNLLKEQINKADNETLCGIEKALSYLPHFKDEYDWDYGYLLNLIKMKLQRMSIYFHTHNIVVDEEKYARQIDIAIKLMNVATGAEEFAWKAEKYPYVNFNNIERFFPKHVLDFRVKSKTLEFKDGNYQNIDVTKNEVHNAHIFHFYNKQMVREEKAWHLLWEWIKYYGRRWWD